MRSSRKYLLTGGGTGGHITPILAVAHELKVADPTCEIIYVGEHSGKFSDLTDGHHAIDQTHTIFAGKFRRYYGQSWLARILDAKTNLLNLRDVFYLLLGIIQSIRLLGKIKPDVILLKGGFVGVPIGLAAALRRRPFVTHDSDVIPGLANRLVGRWASVHATALPEEYYKYPKQKTKCVGVLVEHSFVPVAEGLQKQYKKEIGLPEDAPVLLITGGSSGAEKINKAVVQIIDELLIARSDLQVIHQVGKGKAGVYGNYSSPRLKVLEFLQPMYRYTGAADLVIARASANTLAELGVQGKACIAVPHPSLTAGHQLKNAERLREQEAARIVSEEELYDTQQGLLAVTSELLASGDERKKLARNLSAITKTGAATELALLLLTVINKKQDVQTKIEKPTTP